MEQTMNVVKMEIMPRFEKAYKAIRIYKINVFHYLKDYRIIFVQNLQIGQAKSIITFSKISCNMLICNSHNLVAIRLKLKLKRIPKRKQQKKWMLDSLVTKV